MYELGASIGEIEDNVKNALRTVKDVLKTEYPKPTGIAEIIHKETMEKLGLSGKVVGYAGKGWLDVLFGKETADNIVSKGLEGLDYLGDKINEYSSPEQRKALGYLFAGAGVGGAAVSKIFGKFAKIDLPENIDGGISIFKYKTPKYLSDNSLRISDDVLHTKLNKMVAEDVQMWDKFRKGELDRGDFEVHHMVSKETDFMKNHDLWKISGLDVEDGINKVLLPKKPGGYLDRSSHSGRHTDVHHSRLIESMDIMKNTGLSQGWTTEQFRKEFQDMLIKEREGLINGKIDLYMGKKSGKK